VASAFWKGLYLVFLLIGLFAFNEILIHQKKKKKSNTYISTFRYIYLKRLGLLTLKANYLVLVFKKKKKNVCSQVTTRAEALSQRAFCSKETVSDIQGGISSNQIISLDKRRAALAR
jgi:hypothetical protein